MALMERVATLIRANLNDLVDRAEDPGKLIKQVILDMENQLMQVKTQVAIAMADEHLLKKKHKESEEKASEWMRKAELAVGKNDDELARAAIERARASRQLADNFAQQASEQAAQVEALKTALRKLDQKLDEARAKSEVLVARNRRAKTLNRAGEAGLKARSQASDGSFDRMTEKVDQSEAVSQARTALLGDTVEERLAALERDDEVERVLAELKAGRKAKLES